MSHSSHIVLFDNMMSYLQHNVMLPSNVMFKFSWAELSFSLETKFDGRLPWMEDNLGWKTTLDVRWPWTEDGLEWKLSLLKHDLGWKTTLCGEGLRRWPWMEDDLGGKMTLDWRRPFYEIQYLNGRQTGMEDKLGWKTNWDGRQTRMEDDLRTHT